MSTSPSKNNKDAHPAKAGKYLVIVESPAKAKTINKYLGSDYIVKSSIGHVRDLPTSGSAAATKVVAKSKTSDDKQPSNPADKKYQALVKRMGVDPQNKWLATYEILPGKETVVSELKKLAKNCDVVYLATDLDREGEAIAWHLQQVIGGEESKYKRVVFNEITKNAITQAFDKPGQLDLNRVNAQQARRFLDRVVGYMLSPLLWEKIARGLSAGRVQSVATKLVVEREKEIRAFVPEEYWQIFADTVTAQQAPMRLELAKIDGKTANISNQEQATALTTKLQAATYTISERDVKPTTSRPSAPFITSTLQQAASTRLGFAVKKTMMMAQRLYEAGYITYMRTDSTFISNDAQAMAASFIGRMFGAKYLPDTPPIYGSKAGAQEAHEAIRPSNVDISADQVVGVDRDAQRLYTLIWQQFVASQMTPAQYLATNVAVAAAGCELRAKGRTLVFDGYTKVAGIGNSGNKDVLLPDVVVGDTLTLSALDPQQHFTKPPARFSEASLVKELEKKGIGRPSTYAAIISTIQDRGYVRLDSKRLYAEKMGDIVTDRLSENFNSLMDYSFTAQLEEKLDSVAMGALNWKKVLDDFYKDFSQRLQLAGSETGMRRNMPVEIAMPCKACTRPMQIRTGSTGVFLGCSGYGLPPKERCKETINLMQSAVMSAFVMQGDDEADAVAEVNALRAKQRCSKCNSAMESYVIDAKTQMHICGNNPDCDGYKVETGSFMVKSYEGPSFDCEKCDGQLELKTGRFGPFYACNSCSNTRKVQKNGEPAPPRADAIALPTVRSLKHDDYFVLRDGAAGLFLAASKFPKVRETRAPKIKELQLVAEQLDEKFKYLLSAPLQDDEGNDSIVRFSRKLACQYVSSEKDGKPTKFALYYRNQQWVAE